MPLPPKKIVRVQDVTRHFKPHYAEVRAAKKRLADRTQGTGPTGLLAGLFKRKQVRARAKAVAKKPQVEASIGEWRRTVAAQHKKVTNLTIASKSRPTREDLVQADAAIRPKKTRALRELEEMDNQYSRDRK